MLLQRLMSLCQQPKHFSGKGSRTQEGNEQQIEENTSVCSKNSSACSQRSIDSMKDKSTRNTQTHFILQKFHFRCAEEMGRCKRDGTRSHINKEERRRSISTEEADATGNGGMTGGEGGDEQRGRTNMTDHAC